MINKVYRLISPRQISVSFISENMSFDRVIVRPTKLSICAADQRYYTGSRDKEVLKKKLPMSLIHEAVGEVVYDLKGEFSKGDKVVLIPNTPVEFIDGIDENYLKSSKFRASGFDGFMQDYVFMERSRVIKYNNIQDDIASFIELISVAMHSIKRLAINVEFNNKIIGIWGDGNLGFILALILKTICVNSKIIVFGKNKEKLNFFSFVDEVYNISNVCEDVEVDFAFEAVGGKGSESAIKQIIDHIKPQGKISLLGVSEYGIEIDTRSILEKGITIIGNSRSTRLDFIESIKFLENNIFCQEQLKKIISKSIDIRNIKDIEYAFDYDLNTQFKTIMNWNI